MEVRVYKNLNNGLWSLKARVKGKWVVVGHASRVGLTDVSPYVSDKRHEHVRQGNHREVFAWLTGTLRFVEGFQSYQGRTATVEFDSYDYSTIDDLERVTFHPFAAVKRGFYWVSGDDFEHATRAIFTESAQVYCYA